MSDGEEVVKRWKEHFEGLYQEMNGPGLHMPNEATTLTVLEGDLEIMKEEVRRSVRRLKMRKAPGICGIEPETSCLLNNLVIIATNNHCRKETD